MQFASGANKQLQFVVLLVLACERKKEKERDDGRGRRERDERYESYGLASTCKFHKSDLDPIGKPTIHCFG